MNKNFNLVSETLRKNISGLMSTIYMTGVGCNKSYEETELSQAFGVNADSLGFDLPGDDMPERIFKSFIAATSTFLGKVKVSKSDEAVALVLTDVSGNFKFAGIVEYHENENVDEPGNWSYVLTFNEEDLTDLEKRKKVNKYLYGDGAFKNIFDKICFDIGGIRFKHERFMYDASLIVVDTILQVLDNEAIPGQVVDIELPGYFTCSVEVDGDEKVFAITPDGVMKTLVKEDVKLEK